MIGVKLHRRGRVGVSPPFDGGCPGQLRAASDLCLRGGEYNIAIRLLKDGAVHLGSGGESQLLPPADCPSKLGKGDSGSERFPLRLDFLSPAAEFSSSVAGYWRSSSG